MTTPLLAVLDVPAFRGGGSSGQIAIYFLIAFGALVVVLLVARIIRSRSPSSQGKAASYSRFKFRSFAHRFGLNPTQIEFMEYYARAYNVSNPEFILQNPNALDKMLKKVFADIESHSESDALAEQRKSLMFSIRDIAENTKKAGNIIRSSRQLSSGQTFSLITPENESYPSHFFEVYPNGISAAVPRDAGGNELRLKKGIKVNCTFYSRTGQGYSFPTKILSYEARKNSSAMIISHSDNVIQLPNRQYKRKEYNGSCYFYFVAINLVSEGRKQVKKAVVDKRRVLGTIEDISAGGCSIKTANPLNQGEYLKIEFDTDKGTTASVLGKVVRVNRLKNIGGVMHVKFSRSSRKTLNEIRSFVYGYED